MDDKKNSLNIEKETQTEVSSKENSSQGFSSFLELFYRLKETKIDELPQLLLSEKECKIFEEILTRNGYICKCYPHYFLVKRDQWTICSYQYLILAKEAQTFAIKLNTYCEFLKKSQDQKSLKVLYETKKSIQERIKNSSKKKDGKIEESTDELDQDEILENIDQKSVLKELNNSDVQNKLNAVDWFSSYDGDKNSLRDFLLNPQIKQIISKKKNDVYKLRNDVFAANILSAFPIVVHHNGFLGDLVYILAINEKDYQTVINIVDKIQVPIAKILKDKSYQTIFFGAPGTGKSHTIKQITSGKSAIRTTFHPDSDYSTFVGSYKPVMEERNVQIVPVVTTSGVNLETNKGTYKENRIAYKFVKQAFLKAYLGAWKKYSQKPNLPKEQYLVIEEINRGNCAQIFGDIFQLLDRSDNGFSSYPIEADDDIRTEIAKSFKESEYKIETDLQVDSAVEDYTSNYGLTLSKDIQEGRVLLLPPNLYIWATMNTSDQSLFPIDSAFKRRWEWVYVPINTKEKEWYIRSNGFDYKWGDFLEKVNKKIGDTTNSEDKKLGFYFCKADRSVVSADRFVGKVLFYIYNDIFKDYGFDDEMFKWSDDKQLSYQDFYNVNGSVNEDRVAKLLDNLHVEKQNISNDFSDGDDKNDGENSDENDGNENGGENGDENSGENGDDEGKDHSKYSINGEGSFPKNQVSRVTLIKYIANNPNKSAEEIVNDWAELSKIVPHLIETQQVYKGRKDRSLRSKEVDCGSEKIYVAWNGWTPETIEKFIAKVHEKQWGITIAKIN
jgi:MoxR-like ATPase